MKVKIDLGRWAQRLGQRLRNQLGVNCSPSEARWMMERAFNVSITSLGVAHVEPVEMSDIRTLMGWITERMHYRKPLQYILGDVEFCAHDLCLKTQPPILIPRPETEFMIQWVADLVNQVAAPESIRILDIGTGSGCIAIGLAAAIPNAIVTGLDSNPNAIGLAVDNVRCNDIRHPHLRLWERISMVHLGVGRESSFSGKFDLIVSNAPYVSFHQWNELQDEIRLWEDPEALVAGNCGLAVYSDILDFVVANELLDSSPSRVDLPKIIFEVGEEWQCVGLGWMVEQRMKFSTRLREDQFGCCRWVCGR